ncbi:MAG: YbaB/EbfC family nucleoid-associated protein [Planctomycetota bacterium]
MLGNLGQMMNLLKNAGQIKQQAQEMNQRLQAARFVGESGGGQVKATVDGRGELIGIKFESALVTGGDQELLEDLTVAAVRDAVARSREAIQKEVGELTGGMGLNLPGLSDMFGGGKP